MVAYKYMPEAAFLRDKGRWRGSLCLPKSKLGSCPQKLDSLAKHKDWKGGKLLLLCPNQLSPPVKLAEISWPGLFASQHAKTPGSHLSQPRNNTVHNPLLNCCFNMEVFHYLRLLLITSCFLWTKQ